ncbi:uncharacterized protein [Rutidosis leptorrhynchoides]|uniref:uncharacterized protein n=1 Tax=Rutidosis leptorrhynchoides TaxID=125765 RepID=UPI003A990B86
MAPEYDTDGPQYYRPPTIPENFENHNDSKQTFTQYLKTPTSFSIPSKENGLYNSFFPHHSHNNRNSSAVVGTFFHNFFPERNTNDKVELTEEYAVDLGDDCDDKFGIKSVEHCHNDEDDEDNEHGEHRKHVEVESSDGDHNFISEEEDEEENKNDDCPPKYMTPKDWKENTFSFMPNPPPTPAQNFKPITLPKINDNRNITLVKDVWFVNKDECQKVIAHNSIQEGYEYKIRNSSKTRFDVVCINKGCGWKINTSRATHGDPFHVTSINDTHTCPMTKIKTKHHNAYKAILGDLLTQKLKDPNRVYRPKDIIEYIGDTYHIKISYQQAWRGREAALEKLRGGHAESFNKLPYYFYNLKLKNPATFTEILTDQYGLFDMCFMMLGVSIRTFLKNLIPLIIVGGAHLKGKYPGSNLVAVGMDGNNNIVPLAYGICGGESGRTWTWYCPRDSSNLPAAFHGICCRHLLMNIDLPKKHDWLFWKICKAHTVRQFDYYMEQLRIINENAYDKLNRVELGRWSRAHCPVNRGLVQRWSFERRALGEKYEKLGHILTPYAETKIYKRIRKSNMWKVYGISKTRYQVNDGKSNCLVDLQTKECSCKQWTNSGLPYGHVIAVFKENGIDNCADLAKQWFTMASYTSTYAEETTFVGDVCNWVIPFNYQVLLPPTTNKRNAGRPKKTSRIPCQGERVKIRVCRRCGADDHQSLAVSS